MNKVFLQWSGVCTGLSLGFDGYGNWIEFCVSTFASLILLIVYIYTDYLERKNKI